jgi:hypothetical protein
MGHFEILQPARLWVLPPRNLTTLAVCAEEERPGWRAAAAEFGGCDLVATGMEGDS